MSTGVCDEVLAELNSLSLRFVYLALYLATVLTIGCGKSEAVVESQQRRNDMSEQISGGNAEEQIATLARKNGAEINWLGNIGESDTEAVFSLEIQRAVDSARNTPILIIGEVVDVYRAEANYGVICHPEPSRSYWRGGNNDVSFVIYTDLQTADQVIEGHNSVSDSILEPPYFAFVIRVTGSQVKYKHELYAEGEYIADGTEEALEGFPADAQLVDAGLRPSLTIYGEILDYTLLEDYDPWAEE